MNTRGSYRGTAQPDAETQSVFFNWSAGGISPADSSFYCVHAWTWSSAPAVNTYGTAIGARSRLYGRIRHVCLAVTNSSAGSDEPIGVEIHIFPKKANLGGSPGNQVQVRKVGSFKMTNDTATPSQTQPSHFLCDIPVDIGTVFQIVIRVPVMATNPTGFFVSGVAVIEGISKTKKNIVGSSEFGFKNADFHFGVTGNTSPADSTRYYWPFPQIGGAMITSGQAYQASPIDGYIVGATYAQLTATTSSSREMMDLGVEKKYSGRIDRALITSKHQTLIDTPQGARVNTFVKYYDCAIAIKRGEQFTPFILTPVWGTNPTNIRPYIILHLRGN